MSLSTLAIFAAMALVTFATRYLMIAMLGRDLPAWVMRWLRFVPPAVLAALIAPAALAPEGVMRFGAAAWATAAGGLVAWRTRNVLLTLLAGLIAFWILRALGIS